MSSAVVVGVVIVVALVVGLVLVLAGGRARHLRSWRFGVFFESEVRRGADDDDPPDDAGDVGTPP